MNVKASNKYQFLEQLKSVKQFYIVMILSVVLLSALVTIPVNHSDGTTIRTTFTGLNSASLIFLFICGLSSFAENFSMLLQNGVSRKSLFFGRILTALEISAIMAMIDEILTIIMRLIAGNIGENVYVRNLFELTYSNRDYPGILNFINGYFFDLFLYVTVFIAGSLITILFYRLEKLGRMILGVGIPVTFIVILPLIDRNFTNGAIFRFLGGFFRKIYQFTSRMPINSIILCIAASTILALFSWFVSRRTILKK